MLEQYYRIKQATGITITILPDGESLMDVCSITVTGDQLIINQKLPDLDTIASLKKNIPAKTFVAINLCGKGILHRQIEKAEAIDHHNFNQILPNANFEDFYVQNFISNDQSFVSIIRKTEADKWIDLIRESGFEPLALSLGPFPIQHIISQLNIYSEEIRFNGNIIQRNPEGQLIKYINDPNALSPFVLKIENEVIHEKLITAYAAAFQLVLASQLDPIQAEVEVLETAFQKQQANQQLKVKSFLILAILFVLLLVNLVVFSWLNSANAKLSRQVSRFAQSTTDIQQVNLQIKKKIDLLGTLGWESNINKSVLIDQLASLLPPEISWEELAVDPIDISASRIQKEIVFYNHRIRITGTSEKIIPVNEWIARVKTKSWVKNIQLDNYTFNSELNTGQFSVIIDY